MKVILLERIENLGQMGDEVTVKNGYARNFLLPQKKALRANKENRAYFETQKAIIEATNIKRKEEAQDLAKRMAGLSVAIIKQASEQGQLYGSVSGRDVCEAIKEAGFNIERRQVVLDQAIKNIGVFDIKIALYPEVAQTVKVTVARTQEDVKKLDKEEAKKDALKEQEVA
ncbi:MAG: 50S ribosomal protein L9 [Alphaproteobacteria bacterium ADurb.Bin438]|nr:MAG: 50S ribosomal protein L9 [Alphaproteobacteria bacterium ADurb.Bin438]